MLNKFFIPKTARKVLIVAGLLVVACLFTLRNLKLDYDFEQFFPKNDVELDFYLDFREEFGTDNDFLLVAFQPNNGILNPNFLTNIQKLESELEEIPEVTQCISPLSFKIPIIAPLGFFQTPLLTPKTYQAKDSLRIVNDPLLDLRFISKDRKSLAMLIRHEPFLSKKKSDALLNRIQTLLQQEHLPNYKLAGKVYGQNYYIKAMGSELSFFAATSALLLALFLFISFRSAWGVWLPLLVVVCTVIIDLALITLFGYAISILTTILPTILFVVGISDVVHLTEKYIQELRGGANKTTALKRAYKQIGLATLLTSLTTCIGFLTLLSSSISPIANFGWFAAIGVFVAFILAFTLFPAALLLLPTPKKLISSKNGGDFWKPLLQKCYIFSLRKFGWILGGSTLLIGLSLWGIQQIEINNYLLEDLAKTDPHRQEFMFFENQFGGVRPFQISGSFKQNDLLNWENAKALNDFQQYLTQEYGANNLFSPLQAIFMMQRAKNGGNPDFYNFPDTEKAFNKIKPQLKKALQNPTIKHLYKAENASFRISANVVDKGGAHFRKQNKLLDAQIEHFSKRGLNLRQTGMPMLIDKNNENLSKDMLLGLLIAFAAVGLIMGMMYKSFKMVVIALIPNLIPLILIGGLMFAFGIDLKLSTAIIFTIAFGIAVDDTIHFLARYRLEIKSGKPPIIALKNTYMGAGKAILVTTIILFAGFITLIFSTFSSTFYLGLLVSFTLLIALITDLLLLPGLLYFGLKRKH